MPAVPGLAVHVLANPACELYALAVALRPGVAPSCEEGQVLWCRGEVVAAVAGAPAPASWEGLNLKREPGIALTCS